LLITGERPNQAEDRKNRIRTLAFVWQNTYYLEDTGLFRVSLEHRKKLGGIMVHGIAGP